VLAVGPPEVHGLGVGEARLAPHAADQQPPALAGREPGRGVGRLGLLLPPPRVAEGDDGRRACSRYCSLAPASPSSATPALASSTRSMNARHERTASIRGEIARPIVTSTAASTPP